MLLVAGGIGITAVLAVLHDLVRRNGASDSVARKITLVWVAREATLVGDVFNKRMSPVFAEFGVTCVGLNAPTEKTTGSSFSLSFFLTRGLDISIDVPADYIRSGRPDWDEIFASTAKEAADRGGHRVAVMVCGPPMLVQTIVSQSQQPRNNVRFDCHEEMFGF